jgi:hypothetical protein
VKAKVISALKGTNGTISQSLRQYLTNIPGKHEIKELKQTDILGTANILWKVLNVNVQNTFRVQNNITCSTNSKYRTSATLYILETWLLSGI